MQAKKMKPKSNFMDLLIKQLNTCNRLISKGVSTRLALESVYGKEIADKTCKDIARMQGEQPSINENNN